MKRRAVAWLTVALAVALPALVYALTLAPSLTWAHAGADGGELLAAAASGGIPHPPGFPTYMLLAGLVLRLPWGDPAGRLNALSAAAASLAAGLVTATVWASAARRPAGPVPVRRAWPCALAAGWLFAFAPLVWSQAVITEVYTLAAAFAALGLFLSRGPGREHPFWSGLAWGLGLGVHPTLLFLLPLLWTPRSRRGGWIAVGALAGLLPYALLPLRAAAGPGAWGDPRTLGGWWELVSGAIYRGYLLALPLAEWPRRLLAWLVLLARQLTPLGLPLALYGWSRLRQAAGRTALLEGAALLGGWAFSLAWATSDAAAYLLPGLVLLAAWAGAGLLDLAEAVAYAGRGRGVQRLAPALALLLPLALLPWGWAQADLHDDRTAGRFAAAVMADAPPGAILLTHADRHTFALWAFREALSSGRLPGATAGPRRADVTVVDVDLLAFPWYRASLAGQPGLSALDGAEEPWAVLDAAGRPLCQVDDRGLDCALPGERAAAAERAQENCAPGQGSVSRMCRGNGQSVATRPR